jgi:hypothetical protein
VFEGIGFLLPWSALAAVLGIVVALVALRLHPQRTQVLAFSIAVIAGTAAGMWLGPIHKMHRMRQVTAAAMPLVEAIRAFERDQRRPPRDLTELVPRYVAAVPPTGMRGFSEWVYLTGPDARAYEENPWVLLIHTGGPGFNFDQLMYFPNQHYPEFGHGGWIERMGAWAYVHE